MAVNNHQSRFANAFPEAGGDGPLNGTRSLQTENMLRVRIMVHGNGAGDPGVIFVNVNRRPDRGPANIDNTGTLQRLR